MIIPAFLGFAKRVDHGSLLSQIFERVSIVGVPTSSAIASCHITTPTRYL